MVLRSLVRPHPMDAVRTNVPVSGVVEWAETASDQKFFRAQVP
jgi:hypothetical protein